MHARIKISDTVSDLSRYTSDSIFFKKITLLRTIIVNFIIFIMTVHFIHVRRLKDGLIFASTTDEETSLQNLSNEEERIIKQISPKSAKILSCPTSYGSIHICAGDQVYAVCATSREFETNMAYDLNDEAMKFFLMEYRESIDAVESKYAFMDFSAVLDNIRTKYQRQVANGKVHQLKKDLYEVESSMAHNLQTAIARDEKINEVGQMSENLSRNSGIFAKKAHDLNRLHFWRTYGRPAVILSIVGSVYAFVHFLL